MYDVIFTHRILHMYLIITFHYYVAVIQLEIASAKFKL